MDFNPPIQPNGVGSAQDFITNRNPTWSQILASFPPISSFLASTTASSTEALTGPGAVPPNQLQNMMVANHQGIPQILTMPLPQWPSSSAEVMANYDVGNLAQQHQPQQQQQKPENLDETQVAESEDTLVPEQPEPLDFTVQTSKDLAAEQLIVQSQVNIMEREQLKKKPAKRNSSAELESLRKKSKGGGSGGGVDLTHVLPPLAALAVQSERLVKVTEKLRAQNHPGLDKIPELSATVTRITAKSPEKLRPAETLALNILERRLFNLNGSLENKVDEDDEDEDGTATTGTSTKVAKTLTKPSHGEKLEEICLKREMNPFRKKKIIDDEKVQAPIQNNVDLMALLEEMNEVDEPIELEEVEEEHKMTEVEDLQAQVLALQNQIMEGAAAQEDMEKQLQKIVWENRELKRKLKEFEDKFEISMSLNAMVNMKKKGNVESTAPINPWQDGAANEDSHGFDSNPLFRMD